jgi:hypothetical protein
MKSMDSRGWDGGSHAGGGDDSDSDIENTGEP